MRDPTVEIRGMPCGGCGGPVKALLEREPEVREAVVSFADGQGRVRYNSMPSGRRSSARSSRTVA